MKKKLLKQEIPQISENNEHHPTETSLYFQEIPN